MVSKCLDSDCVSELKLKILISVQDDVEHLILTERIETIIPLTYVAIMAMAFYGPNAEIMGSVKLQIWHRQNVIEDFGAFAVNIVILFFVDFLSFIINGYLIWKFCNINPLKVLCDIQKRFWFIMMLVEAHLLSAVSTNEVSTIIKVLNKFLPIFSEHPSTYAWRRHGLNAKI